MRPRYVTGPKVFVKKAHEEGFYNIVSVVAKGYKIAAAFLGGVVQCATPKLCAKGAGVAFLADVEHNIAYVGFDNVKRHVYAARKFLHRCKILVRQPKIEHHAAYVKMPVTKPLIQL